MEGNVRKEAGGRTEVLLFDNDGVLVDTERLYFDANRMALEPLGIPLGRETYIDLFLKHAHGLQKLAGDAGMPPGDIERLRLRRNAIYVELLEAGVGIMPGVREALSALSGKYRMAVVTSAYRAHFDIIHRSHGLLGFFEFVVTVEDFKKWKPDPEPYLRAVEKTGAQADLCVAVEDSARGLISASGAGIRCVVVPHDLTRGQDFSTAWAVLDGIGELPGFLAREARSGLASRVT
jgi:HAD superfamily hydrolase (TIGR01509 family)